MSMSCDAYVFFGYGFDEVFEFPWENVEHELYDELLANDVEELSQFALFIGGLKQTNFADYGAYLDACPSAPEYIIDDGDAGYEFSDSFMCLRATKRSACYCVEKFNLDEIIAAVNPDGVELLKKVYKALTGEDKEPTWCLAASYR